MGVQTGQWKEKQQNENYRAVVHKKYDEIHMDGSISSFKNGSV
jgi:hypothetical protein